VRLLLAAWSIALAALLILALSGATGSLQDCGTDRAALCVGWPVWASAGVWTVFIAAIGALVAIQSRDWRSTSVDRRELLGICGIVVVAAIERTWRLDLTQLAYDETSAASLVAAWHYQGLFPLTGIVSSVGIPNPPGWPYLLALALLPFDSPYALVGLGVANGLLAVGLVWWVARRWIGAWGGLAAAIFYAGGFWSTVLGRGGWQPEFLQIPVILCFDALLVLAVRRRPWLLAVAAGWVGLMVQLHYVAVLFAVLLPVAAWPARAYLRPRHVVVAALMPLTLLAPFLMYELHPSVRVRDFLALASDAGVTARWDLDSWNLTWTLASNGGAAGLGGPDAAGLALALGRWTQVGLVGTVLVAIGFVVAMVRWPRGWQGALIAVWLAAPIALLARHTQGVLFHYLYLGLPGMAFCVGALFEASRNRVRWLAATALAAYVCVSAATLWVVLEHADRTGVYPGLGKPLGLNMAAARAASAMLPPGGEVLIGGYGFEVDVLRFALGFSTPSRVFDDCGPVPPLEHGVYLLNSQRTPAFASLQTVDAPLLARVDRPDGDAFVVLGPALAPVPAPAVATDCGDRFR
jgi:hypothetical protein